jgi:hypothetical protein
LVARVLSLPAAERQQLPSAPLELIHCSSDITAKLLDEQAFDTHIVYTVIYGAVTFAPGAALRSPQELLLCCSQPATEHGRVECALYDRKMFQELRARLGAPLSTAPVKTLSEHRQLALVQAEQFVRQHLKAAFAAQQAHFDRSVELVWRHAQSLVDETGEARRSQVASQAARAVCATVESEQCVLSLTPMATLVLEYETIRRQFVLQTQRALHAHAPAVSAVVERTDCALDRSVRWSPCAACTVSLPHDIEWNLCYECHRPTCIDCVKQCLACHGVVCSNCATSARCPRCMALQLRTRGGPDTQTADSR